MDLYVYFKLSVDSTKGFTLFILQVCRSFSVLTPPYSNQHHTHHIYMYWYLPRTDYRTERENADVWHNCCPPPTWRQNRRFQKILRKALIAWNRQIHLLYDRMFVLYALFSENGPRERAAESDCPPKMALSGQNQSRLIYLSHYWMNCQTFMVSWWWLLLTTRLTFVVFG